MPQDYTLKNFLINHKAEVLGMLDIEYNEEEVWETFKQDYYRIGREEGKEEAYLDSVKSLMWTMNLSVEKAVDALCISDEERKDILRAMQGWKMIFGNAMSF